MSLNFIRWIPDQVRNDTGGFKSSLITAYPIELMLSIFFLLCSFSISAELNPKQEDVFARRDSYTVTNNTQDPIDLTWQSGGGSGYDVLNGKEGSLYLSPVTSPSNAVKIVTPGDCLDFIEVKSKSTSTVGRRESICKEKIAIKYEGEDIKNQKLVLSVS